MVRLREARKKGARMAFVECLGVSQVDTMKAPLWRETLGKTLGSYDAGELVGGMCHGNGVPKRFDIFPLDWGMLRRSRCVQIFKDTMKGPLWRETLGRRLGSHDAAELVGGMCHGNDSGQETTRLHAISCTKTGWSSLTHNRVLQQALARSLSESKVRFVVENTWPFRERAGGQNGILNRMDATTEVGILFDNHPRRKNKALPLDINIVNPCASSNLDNAAMQEITSPTQSSGRKTSIGARFPLSTPTSLSLCRLMSTYGEVGSDVHALTKELAIRRVEHRSETHSNDSYHLAEGTQVARLHILGDSILFYSKLFHSARVTISADWGWRLRALDSSVRKARCLYTLNVPRG